MTNKIDTSTFINKSKHFHGDKYDYSKSIYTNAKTKLIITCPVHGDFYQLPGNHYKYGCLKCSGTYKRTTSEFIKRAKEIHGDKYLYDKSEYTTNNTKLIITCPIHGDFKQAPIKHLFDKNGCPECAKISRISKKTKTYEEFVEEANSIHNNFYNYDKSIYVNNRTKLIITCPVHGDFEQSPTKHITSRQGCPTCKKSQGEVRIEQCLKDNDVLYEPQKKFEDCKNIFYLPFDFYLPELGLCIEYDGKQHFEPYFKIKDPKIKEEELRKVQFNDAIKNKYCKDNNIKLIRIPYWDFDRIEEILTRELNI